MAAAESLDVAAAEVVDDFVVLGVPGVLDVHEGKASESTAIHRICFIRFP
ncbi:hypothetical protein GCM10025759_32580 [Lysobacter panacisoli]|uniref:Uncharacterized protein n=1 Tax=Lysobacter panacisoli TaxID=1255263 RepID=A0ABP9LSD6_9GAMM